MNFDLNFRSDGREADDHIQRLTQSLNGLSAKAATTSLSMGSLLGMFGVQFTAQYGIQKIKETLENAKRLIVEAERAAVGTDTIQAWEYAARKKGASIDDIFMAYRKLQLAIVGAVGGNTGQQSAFDRFGISLDDLKKKTPEELFEKLSRGIEKAGSSAQTMTDVITLLGRGATSVLPALADGFADVAAKAKGAGQVIDTEVLQKLADLHERSESLSNRLTVMFAPLLGFFASAGTSVLHWAKLVMETSPGGALIRGIGAKTGGASVTDALRAAGAVDLDRIANEAAADLGMTGKQSSRKRGGAIDPDALSRTADLQKANAKALADLLFSQLTAEEKKTDLIERQNEIYKQITAGKLDEMQREELFAQYINNAKQLGSAAGAGAMAGRGNRAATVDAMAKIGLFVGAPPLDQTRNIAREHLEVAKRSDQKLGDIKAELSQL